MIDKYIAELLKTNTRVIVPDFGAFMVKTAPGSSEKQVSFNDFLKYNDGLLVNHIVKKEGITKEEAQKKVKSFVEEIQNTLKSNKPFKVADLGYLYKDPRGSVRFKKGDEKPAEEKPAAKEEAKDEGSKTKPSVTLDDKSKTTPHKKDDTAVEKKPDAKAEKPAADKGAPEKSTDKTKDDKTAQPKTGDEGKTLNEKYSDKKQTGTTGKTQVKSGMPEAKKSSSSGQPPHKKPPQTKSPQKPDNTTIIIVTAAIVVVLGAAGVIGYLNWDEWFGGKEQAEVMVDSTAIKAREQARLDSLRRVQARQASIEQARQDSIKKAEARKKKNQKKYYLVAGSFKTKKYADMFVEKLRSEGYDSEIFMQRRGFYRVSFNSYVDRQKAFNEYRRMKNQDIQVWVLRH